MQHTERTSSQQKSFLFGSAVVCIAASCFLLAACSSTNKSESQRTVYGDSQTVTSPGSIVIAKRFPPKTELENVPLYGFLPFSLPKESAHSPAPAWIEVNITQGTLSIHQGTSSVFSTQFASDRANLASDKTKVLTVAENPTWHAPDSYFTERGLPIPPEGDSKRFLKGALGKSAIFLENGTVIHSGPAFQGLSAEGTSPEGVQLEESTFQRVASLLQPGTKVVIR